MQADDIFSLCSVLYFIISGKEPYSKLDEEEAGRRFGNLDLPASIRLSRGNIILITAMG